MPMLNNGTLIENIALVETARVLFRSSTGARFEFVNSFAMPLLTRWSGKGHNQALNCTTLRRLALSGAAPRSLTGLLKSCHARYPDYGASGALLVALLSTFYPSQRVHYWLNDLHGTAYTSNAIAPCSQLFDLTQELRPSGPLPASVALWPGAYPASLSNLRQYIHNVMAKSVTVRLGFLDPMKYVIGKRAGNETSSKDHRDWLSLLLSDKPMVAASVHFSGVGRGTWEISSLKGDASAMGYVSNTFSHGALTTTVSIHHREDPKRANQLLRSIHNAVLAAWNQWFKQTNSQAKTLMVDYY